MSKSIFVNEIQGTEALAEAINRLITSLSNGEEFTVYLLTLYHSRYVSSVYSFLGELSDLYRPVGVSAAYRDSNYVKDRSKYLGLYRVNFKYTKRTTSNISTVPHKEVATIREDYLKCLGAVSIGRPQDKKQKSMYKALQSLLRNIESHFGGDVLSKMLQEKCSIFQNKNTTRQDVYDVVSSKGYIESPLRTVSKTCTAYSLETYRSMINELQLENTCMSFGKHKGKLISSLQPGYLDFISNIKTDIKEFDEYRGYYYEDEYLKDVCVSKCKELNAVMGLPSLVSTSEHISLRQSLGLSLKNVLESVGLTKDSWQAFISSMRSELKVKVDSLLIAQDLDVLEETINLLYGDIPCLTGNMKALKQLYDYLCKGTSFGTESSYTHYTDTRYTTNSFLVKLTGFSTYRAIRDKVAAGTPHVRMLRVQECPPRSLSAVSLLLRVQACLMPLIQRENDYAVSFCSTIA